MDRQWCSQQLYHFIAAKMEGLALAIVRNLQNSDHRGVKAWYRIMRDAEGKEDQRVQELADKLFTQPQKMSSAEGFEK